ncbi:anaerobic sulfatase maturase [Vibrio sp. WXL210]|uniref:anaerobic sulfatase maturase n=1 Tax=Vibrio sp. WXL210 TaxID=3450709 RepID=UPI003EC8310C
MSTLPTSPPFANSCRVMAKPSSSVCNLDCEYCFYLEKEHLYPERKENWKMSIETLETYIRQQSEAQFNGEVTFSWQGGEPTLMGLDYFRKAIEFQAKYAKDLTVHNAFQTNGILINDEWCEFFKQHNFLVGVSVDGPAHLHDKYRTNRAGKPTHDRVHRAMQLLKKHGVDFNTLTVVNAENAKYPEEVYEYLVKSGSNFLQFIPLVEQLGNEVTADGLTLIHPDLDMDYRVTEWSVPPKRYGDFLSRMFDLWVERDIGRVHVNMFESTLSAWCGEPTGLCVLSPTCGHNFALESSGDLYSCDHYVYPEFRLGNIHESSILQMNNSDKAITFGRDKHDKLTDQCKTCPFRPTCNGGCPKHRFITSASGEPRHNYLCEGYHAFFQHSAQRMQIMSGLVKQGRSPAELSLMLAQQKMQRQNHSAGRNDPCPCGSGKKYKKCCG